MWTPRAGTQLGPDEQRNPRGCDEPAHCDRRHIGGVQPAALAYGVQIFDEGPACDDRDRLCTHDDPDVGGQQMRSQPCAEQPSDHRYDDHQIPEQRRRPGGHRGDEEGGCRGGRRGQPRGGEDQRLGRDHGEQPTAARTGAQRGPTGHAQYDDQAGHDHAPGAQCDGAEQRDQDRSRGIELCGDDIGGGHEAEEATGPIDRLPGPDDAPARTQQGDRDPDNDEGETAAREHGQEQGNARLPVVARCDGDDTGRHDDGEGLDR